MNRSPIQDLSARRNYIKGHLASLVRFSYTSNQDKELLSPIEQLTLQTIGRLASKLLKGWNPHYIKERYPKEDQ